MIHQLDAISDFIAKGRLRLGMTRAELHGILGPPDEEGGTSRKYRMPSIYKYGDVQFVFPGARSVEESESQGLLYVYVDDDVEGVEEPLFLLQQGRDREGAAGVNSVGVPNRDESPTGR
jgi:hypothetical protein